MSREIRIATRKSALALWQAEYVKARLEQAHPGLQVSLVPMVSRGDKLLDVNDGLPMAQPGQIAVANRGRNNVSVVNVPGNGGLGALSDYSLPTGNPTTTTARPVDVLLVDGPAGSSSTASVAQNGPDVMGMWSGSYMLALKDFLEPLNPYFSAEERARITGWEATSADFRVDSDQIYGVPAGSDGTSCFYYNTELLAKAGLPYGFEATVLTIPSIPSMFANAQVVQANLKRIGVTLRVESVDYSQWVQRWQKKEFDATLNSSTGFADPDTAFYRAFHSKAQNWNNVASPELDRLLDEGRAIFEIEKRKPIYDKVQLHLLEKPGHLFLFSAEPILTLG